MLLRKIEEECWSSWVELCNGTSSSERYTEKEESEHVHTHTYTRKIGEISTEMK